jgi:HEAT repeat protein
LERLIQWSGPEKLDRALLALSIPRDVVDAAFRRVLDDAMRFGLALPDPLRARAVSLGVAGEPGELVARQIDAFRTLASRSDRGGLGIDEVATNWEQLLASAADNEVAIDAATHDVAWQAIRAARGEASGTHALAPIDPAKIPEMGPPELVLLLEHPKARRLAALEICRRKDPELVDTLYKAVRKMPRADVVRIAPKIAAFGEAAGDALIDGLSARKTFVRQASALTLGELKLRRAVVPLVHLLQSEPSDIWQEVARVLGEFGMASFRTLARVLKDPKTAPERFPYALAHLANHGCAKQVDELTRDSDSKVSGMAQKALEMRDDVQRHAKSVRGEAEVEASDSVRQFSRRFYQELGGTAPAEDLAGPSD